MSVHLPSHHPQPQQGAERLMLAVAGIGLLPLLLLALVAVLALTEPRFLGTVNLLNILRSASVLAVVASGQMLVLIVGGFDLSVGAVVALSSTVGATAMAGAVASGVSPALAITAGCAAGLGAGALVGLVNGLCVAVLKVSPFMVTLGTMSAASGVALLLTNGIPVYGLPDGFVTGFGRAVWLGLPSALVVSLILLGVVAVLQRHTLAGPALRAVGGNVQAARVSGVAVRGWTVSAYVGCSLLAALTGLLLTARIGSGQASLGGLNMTMESIATAVIAGVSLRGGAGRVEMVALGAVFLAVISNAMNLSRVDSKAQLVVLGVILIAAVALDELGKRRRVRV